MNGLPEGYVINYPSTTFDSISLPREGYFPEEDKLPIDWDYGDKNGKMEIAELDNFYAGHGYFPTGTGPADADVMFYSEFHAARRMEDCSCGSGRWRMFESKCGRGSRIEHVWDQLNGGNRPNFYCGVPVRFYKKNPPE